MTTQEALLEAVGGLFEEVDSLRVDITYVQPGVASYTPGTGSATAGDTSHSLRGLFYQFKETDGEEVRPTDRRLELDANDVTWFPRAQTDYVTSPDPADASATIRETVHAVLSGPQQVSVVLHMRRAT
ncbi:hypothetical protein LCGC14_1455120 [marine sediment metagenome]|uniref:Uncharacterized protein n=1 Tax=marine sediment metagenome TaxID=412755 RepID=A0A0F9K2Y6_9ZZZZ